MATTSRVEIRCGNCGYWMPAHEGADADNSVEASALLGATVQCRKCLKRTVASAANMRTWAVPDAT